jgi:hypothetical protein
MNFKKDMDSVSNPWLKGIETASIYLGVAVGED